VSEPDERLEARVRGRVQGVFYRASTRERALELGLIGWVRNLADGRVELCAEGPREALERLVAWCREGPPAARVEGVELSWSQARGEMRGFRVLR
jgi:acylphosphatase